MKVVFFTIVLDGLPWISCHYPVFRTLPFAWKWHIVEGVAAPSRDTSWCRPIPARLSHDGTTQYLDSLSFDRRIHLSRRDLWQGKVEMVNEAISSLHDPCLLWQVDSDELWTAPQIECVRSLFRQYPSHTSAQFYCRYFVGPSLITTPRGLYGNREYDWVRVWRFEPGMRFATHEPPALVHADGSPVTGARFTQAETARLGLVFDHYAYALRPSVEFKASYYGTDGRYKQAVEGWERLQSTTTFPVKLRDYFPWVKDAANVTSL